MRETFLIALFVFSSAFLFGQTDTVRLRSISKEKKTIVTDRPPQALYVGLGGSGPILSFNYDRRFLKKVNGFGFTAGLGFWGVSGVSIFSVPVSLNYLAGKDSHFLEIAGGTTFLSAQGDLFSDNSSSSAAFIFHINVGYRYQPTKGGFFFRGGISPLFGQGEYVTSYYLGFGHNF
ncbi:MAG TPA: hypothetical protein VG847_07105 [Chitinophagaceae bacterium]|nr:hypothetical protein [Chitinophagaceae bacterium]